VNDDASYFTPNVKTIYQKGLQKAEVIEKELKDIALTEREKEIVSHIATGKTTDEIGVHLGLSSHTVSSHRKKIYRKTGLNSVADLTNFAIKAGLHEP
ncbi:MAG: helix-turn-helix transcriptional regulator, partial [Flavobacteriales bacterium]|nr:helix-turn-helix transcriptional regulator [Flavobacteriales bacterium]